MQQKEFEIVAIIASRKTEFYLNAGDQLISLLPPGVDKDQVRLRLRQAIAELDDMLFVSEEEKTSNTIRAGLAVSQLNLNRHEIEDRILAAMTKT